MRKFFRVLGWVFLILAIVLGFLGLMSLPTGGLMFALAYVFFIPGAVFLIIGAALLLATRAKAELPPEKQREENEDRERC